jgi:hypothetical protein
MSLNKALDKYYTPKHIVDKCIQLLHKVINKDDILEYLEPSAGNGSFSLELPNCIAYDIEPEHDSIIKADFLSLDIEYKKGRVVIGNPPFGERNNMARKFYKKSVKIADVVAFILPIPQLNNTQSLYDFDLIKSVDLGDANYSGLNIRCCFNIFIRPKNGLNKKPKIDNKLFDIYREDDLLFNDIVEDFKIYCRGGNIGKLIPENKEIKSTYKIVVHDKNNLDYVKNTILNYDWITWKSIRPSWRISKTGIYNLFNQ